MPLSYSGVYLTLPSAEAVAWCVANLDPREIYVPFEEGRAYPGLERPWRAQALLPPVIPGRLHWPFGAARWGAGWFLATDSQLSAIRTAVYGTSGTSYTAQNLVMDDGRGKAVTASLWMLPPRPLMQISGSQQLWLLPLVSSRYRWWEKTANITVTAGTTTWAALISSIATALGVTITTDTISSSYLKPDPSIVRSPYEPLPLLLDRVLASIGHRLVEGLGGTFTTQSAGTAKSSQDAQVSTYSKVAGGTLNLSASGTPCDLLSLVPSSLTVVFPRQDDGLPNAAPYTVNKTLAGLSLSDFGNYAGHDGIEVIQDTAVAYYASGVLQNAAELSALAGQVATAYYEWELARLDLTYAGTVPYTPEAFSFIDWTWQEGCLSTRVQRGIRPAPAEYQMHLGATYGSQSTVSPGITTATSPSNVATTTVSQGVVVAPTSTSSKPLQIEPPSGSTQATVTTYYPGDTTKTTYQETYQGVITQKVYDSATSTQTAVYTYSHNTSGTPTTNYGLIVQYQLQDSTTPDVTVATDVYQLVTATHATMQSQVTYNLWNNTGVPIPWAVTQTDANNHTITSFGGSSPVTAETVSITAQSGGYTPLTLVAGSSPTVNTFQILNSSSTPEVYVTRYFQTVLAASTTNAASLNIPAGTAPTSPQNGDVWNDGTHIYFRVGGVTQQLDQQGGSSGLTVGTTTISSGTSGYVLFDNGGVVGEEQFVPLAHGGTHADLSGTGGTGQVLQQSSAGADITVGAITVAMLPAAQNPALGATLTLSGSGVWQWWTINYTDLQVAATSKTITLGTMPAKGCVVRQPRKFLAVTFAGAAGAALTLGWAGGSSTATSTAGYAGSISLTSAADTLTQNTSNALGTTFPDCENRGSTWTLTATCSAMANLSNFSAGQILVGFELVQPGF